MGTYEIESESSKKPKGCQCSVAVGFLLLLLAIAIAVGVGLIVHFAQKDSKKVVCSVDIAGINIPQGLQGCIALARNNTEAICSACSSKMTSRLTTASTRATPSTTTVNMTIETTPSPTPVPTTTPLRYPYRLPGDFTPISYTLSFKPDFYQDDEDDFMLYGQSSVKVMCHKDTSEIIMHARDIDIANDSIIVRADNDAENLFDSYEMYEPTAFIIIKTKTALTQGRNYTIEFKDFSYPLRPRLFGIYKNMWRINGQNIYLAASQMHPLYARIAFPCFDEPAMKAVFDITIYRKDGQVALSNMPVMKTENSSDGWIRETFQQTPLMSPYLVVVIVAQLTSTSTMYDNRFPMSIWTHETQAASREFALNISLTLMKHFENYFGINFSLPKLDHIVVGTIVAPRQMENWGAQVYRRTSLLYREGQSESVKDSIARHVAHSISHNWFGNLVTPAWWDDGWLIEAFTYYMRYTGLQVLMPERKPFQVMMVNAFLYGMDTDSRWDSEPLFTEGLETGKQIVHKFFYTGVYRKGGYLIRMLEKAVGENVFTTGVNRYLTKYAYGSTGAHELWEEIQIEADLANSKILDISEIMDTFVNQMGFPIVHVEFVDDGRFRLTQSRFLADPTAEDPGKYKSEYGYRWSIPFSFTSSQEKDFDRTSDVVVMDYKDDSTLFQSDRIPSRTGDNWIIGNLQAMGFFIVNYDNRNWEAICKQLNTDYTVIAVLNRYQIVHDTWNLAKTGNLDMDIAVRCTKHIINERGIYPWYETVRNWRSIHQMTNGFSVFWQFKKLIAELLKQPFEVVSGMPPSSEGYSSHLKQDQMPCYAASNLESKLFANLSKIPFLQRNPPNNTPCLCPMDVVVERDYCNTGITSLIIKESYNFGVKASVDFSLSQIGLWMDDPANKPANITDDLQEFVYCNAVRYGGDKEWKFMLNLFETSGDMAALKAMACTSERRLLVRYVELINSTSKYTALGYIKSDLCMPWDLYRSNYEDILEKLGASSTMTLLSDIASGFNTELRLKELEHFAQKNDMTSDSTVTSAISKVKENIKWVKSHVPALSDWLTSSGY